MTVLCQYFRQFAGGNVQELETKYNCTVEPTSILVDIVSNKIDISQGFSFVNHSQQGAIASFLGIVREHNLGKIVRGISYDVHELLAINIFKEICRENLNRYGNILKQFVVHYKGDLDIGGISIAIVVSAPHRREAIDACQYIIESVKHRAPIWKQEHYNDHSSEWVRGHSLCQH